MVEQGFPIIIEAKEAVLKKLPISDETIAWISGFLRKDQGLSFNSTVFAEINERDFFLAKFIESVRRSRKFPFSFSLGVQVLWKALAMENEKQSKSGFTIDPLLARQTALKVKGLDEKIRMSFNKAIVKEVESLMEEPGVFKLLKKASEALNCESLYDQMVWQNQRADEFVDGFATYLTLTISTKIGKLDSSQKLPEIAGVLAGSERSS